MSWITGKINEVKPFKSTHTHISTPRPALSSKNYPWAGLRKAVYTSFGIFSPAYLDVMSNHHSSTWIKDSAAHTSSGGRRRWGGLWVIRVGLKTETEDERERNARKGWKRGKRERERTVRNNGVATFISLWICMCEGGTEREEGRDGEMDLGRKGGHLIWWVSEQGSTEVRVHRSEIFFSPLTSQRKLSAHILDGAASQHLL